MTSTIKPRGFRKSHLTRDAIVHAYRTAGVNLPESLQDSEVLAGLREYESVGHVERRIVDAFRLGPTDDAGRLVAELIEDYGRAMAADKIRERLAVHTKTANAAAVDTSADPAREHLHKWYAKRLRDLGKAAEGLPAGAETDVETITVVGAGKAYLDSQEALKDLSAWFPLTRSQGVGGNYQDLCDLAVYLDFEEVGPRPVHPLTGKSIESPNPARDGIRQLQDVVKRHGYVAGLLRAVAGRIHGVTVSLSKSPEQTKVRALAAKDALTDQAAGR